MEPKGDGNSQNPNPGSEQPQQTPQDAPGTVSGPAQPQQQPNPQASPQMPPQSSQPQKPMTAKEMQGKKGPFKKLSGLSIGIIAAVLLVITSAAAYFGVYLPNQPENIWKSALDNTAKGYDELVAYGEEQQDIKGAKITGNLSINSGGQTGDGNLDLTVYENEATGSFDVGFAGQRFNADIRAVEIENADYPDLYFKVGGIRGLGGFVGGQAGQQVDALDNQWVFVDHTLFSQAVSSASSDSSNVEITPEEATEIAQAVGEVNKEYLFNTDESKAVFNVAEAVGKEDFEGRESYKFRVGVNKDNLKDYVQALKDRLKETKLTELMGDEYDQAFDSAIESADDIEGDDTVDVWVDMDTKLIRNVRIADENNENNYADISLLYEGGDSYPFRMKFNDEDSKTDAEITMTLNTAEDSAKLDFNVKSDSEFSPMDVSGSFKVVPHNEALNVEAPSGAISILEIIGALYGAPSGSLGGSSSSSSSSFSSDSGSFGGSTLSNPLMDQFSL